MNGSEITFVGQPKPRRGTRASADPLAELTAVKKEAAVILGRLSDATDQSKRAAGEIRDCKVAISDTAPRMWIDGDYEGSEKLEKATEVRLQRAEADKERADRRVALLRPKYEQAKDDVERVREELIGYLAVDLDNQQIAAFEKARARAVAALTELQNAHAQVESAYAPLKPAFTAYVELPGGERLANVVRVPKMPIDPSAASALASFDVRPPAMHQVLADHADVVVD